MRFDNLHVTEYQQASLMKRSRQYFSEMSVKLLLVVFIAVVACAGSGMKISSFFNIDARAVIQ